MQQDQVILATLKDVSIFTQSLEGQLSDLPPEIRTAVVLAVQELSVNIVEHAYAGVTGSIRFHLDRAAGRLQMTFVDDAPNIYVPHDISAPDPLDLPEGGMGMFIIYQTFDRVTYERLPAGNRWTLFKEI
jgi:anti-sigma regulatory factor (Ser/Thr protein kinase)